MSCTDIFRLLGKAVRCVAFVVIVQTGASPVTEKSLNELNEFGVISLFFPLFLASAYESTGSFGMVNAYLLSEVQPELQLQLSSYMCCSISLWELMKQTAGNARQYGSAVVTGLSPVQ